MPSPLELVWVSVSPPEHVCPQDTSFRTELEQLRRPLDEEFKHDLTSSGPIFELMRLSVSVAQTLVNGTRAAGPWGGERTGLRVRIHVF